MRIALLLGCAVLGLMAAPALAQEKPVSAMKLTSAVFQDGKAIPAKYTCDGPNVSPPLSWSGAPDAAAGFALIVEDPDAPSGLFTHWIAFNMPAQAKALAEGQSQNGFEGKQGINTLGKTGYSGPCPPQGQHRYVFRLYALSAPLSDTAGASRDAFNEALKGHAIAETDLTGVYAH